VGPVEALDTITDPEHSQGGNAGRYGVPGWRRTAEGCRTAAGLGYIAVVSEELYLAVQSGSTSGPIEGEGQPRDKRTCSHTWHGTLRRASRCRRVQDLVRQAVSVSDDQPAEECIPYWEFERTVLSAIAELKAEDVDGRHEADALTVRVEGSSRNGLAWGWSWNSWTSRSASCRRQMAEAGCGTHGGTGGTDRPEGRELRLAKEQANTSAGQRRSRI